MFLTRERERGDSIGRPDLVCRYEYGGLRALVANEEECFRWTIEDDAFARLVELTGIVRLEDGRAVALYERRALSTKRVRGAAGDWSEYVPVLQHRGFAGAHRKGVEAALAGDTECPYDDARTYRGGVTFSRAWAKQWEAGFALGEELKATLEGWAT